MNVYSALDDAVSLVTRVAPIILAALLASNIVFSSEIFRSIMLQASRKLPIPGGAAMVAFLIHPILGVSILSAMRRRGEMSGAELAASIAISTFPRGLRAILLFLIPVALPTLGVGMCLKLVSLDLVSRLAIVAMVVLLFGACRNVELGKADGMDIVEVLRVFARVIVILFLSSFVVSLLFDSRDGEMAILVSGAMSTTAAIGVAGTLLYRGLIDANRALFLLLVSRVLHVFVEAARMSMPIYTSFFGVREGTKLLLVHVCCDVAALSLAALLALAL